MGPGVKCLCPLMEKSEEKSAELEPSETRDKPGRILIAEPMKRVPLVVSDVHDSNGSDPL